MRHPGRGAKGSEFGGKIAEWPPNSTLDITTEPPPPCRAPPQNTTNPSRILGEAGWGRRRVFCHHRDMGAGLFVWGGGGWGDDL